MSGIIDFRLRPPLGGFLTTIMFREKERTMARTRQLGLEPAQSVLELSVERLLAEMDEAGVTIGVITGRNTGSGFGTVTNEEVVAITAGYPGRFVACGGINPGDTASALREVDRIAGEWGMPAVSMEPGFAPQPMRANDRRLYPIYARCADRGLPVILTLSLMTGPDVSYCLPVDVDQVAHDFPGLKLVIAHACWPWVQPILGVAFRRTNVYLSPDIYAINLPGRDDFTLAARTYLQDRFLFASGYPFAPVGGAVQAYRAMGFSGEIADKIFRRNAAALLRLDGP
ncbi:MAG TPA: amidohydrolase family protein [Candidatus Methylomirabilis sp.]|nr:amidohydrolase family protein [Candidatus Methylomirabilis sp.]